MKKFFSFLTAILFAGSMMAADYVKVTEAPTDWSGDYLFVYEAENVAFNGGLATLDAAANTIAVEITDEKIAATDATNAAKFTLAAVEGGYSVQSASGKFIGVGSYGNGLKQADAVGSYVHNSLTIDESGNAIIGIYNASWNTTGGTMILNFNANKSDKRFRYYKDGSQKKIQLYKYVAEAAQGGEEPTTKTIYLNGGGASLWNQADPEFFVHSWGGAADGDAHMTLVEGDVYKADIPADNTDLLFLRLATGTTEIVWSGDAHWNQSANQTIPEGKDLFTMTSWDNGEWSVYKAGGDDPVVEEPAVIKLHGNFTGDWANTDAFTLSEDKKTATLKLTLNKGNYEFGMRIGADDNWTSNGVAFTRENKSAVVAAGTGNLTLAADTKGDYIFTWTYAANTLAIDFPEYVETLPEMQIAGAWDVKDNAWVKNAMTPAEDKKTASYEVELKAGDYEFKVIKDGAWLAKANEGNAYGLHREWTGVAGVVDQNTLENLKLTADVDGKYTFVWTFANDSLSVVFPAKPAELQAVSAATTWDFSKITANTGNALYNKEGIQLTDASTPNKNDEMVYANYSADFMTFAEGFDAATMAFKGEYPIRKNQYCQAGTLHFKTTVAGTITVKFSDTGSSASTTAVKRYLVVNGEQTEYWTSRGNNSTDEDKAHAAQLNVTSGEIAVPAGDVTITGSSAIVVYTVTFTPEAPAKFYITGNEALLGEKAWNPAAIKVTEDSYTFENLAAGDYKLKVTDGAWSSEEAPHMNLGYDALTQEDKTGLTADNDNNICFTLKEAGNVVVTYKVEEEVVTFTVTGNFFVRVPEYKDLYLVPGVWAEADAKIAAWIWDKEGEMEAQFTAFFAPKAENNDTLVAKIDAAADSITFVRFNKTVTAPTWENEAENVWNKMAADSIDYTSLTYTITDWAAGTWKVYVPETPAKFYITGDEALLGEDAWNADAIKVTEDSYTFENLAAGDYKLKVTLDGTWNDGMVKGFDALTQEDKAGLTADKDNNICFTLAEAGNVTVTYTAETFTVTGNFYVAPVEPTAKFYITGSANLVGEENEWQPNAIPVMEDSKVLALEAGDYMLKLTMNGTWEGENNVKGYDALTGEIPAGVTRGTGNNDDNICFTLAEAGNVTVTYTAEAFTIEGDFYVAPVEEGCDWENIEFLGGPAENANQFKVCKPENVSVVNIQNPNWSEKTQMGIYMTFPSAAFGEISLDEALYEKQGAGILFFLSAFTAQETEFVVNCDGNDLVITVYNAKASEPVVEHTYTVAGSSEIAFGTAWDPENAANDMVKQEDGTYKWEKAELTLAAGPVQFKVCEDHAWKVAYPAENYQLPIAEAGIYTITITFDPATQTVAANAVKTGSAEVDPTVSVKGSWDEWANELVFVLAEDKQSATLTVNNIATGLYEFKVILNGGDWRSNSHVFTREAASSEGITGNDEANMKLLADVEGEYTFTWTFATNSLAIEFPEGGIIPEPVLADGYYLVGDFNDWEPAAEYLFAANEGAEGEFILTTTLAGATELKVVYVVADQKVTWFGANNYQIPEELRREVNIYFRPEANAAWTALDGHLYIEKDIQTGIDPVEVDPNAPALKVLHNGQLLIIKGDRTYNVMGTLVR